MAPDFDMIRAVVQAVADRLHHASRWTVVDLDAITQTTGPRPDLPPSRSVLVTLDQGGQGTAAVYFSLDVPTPHAVVAVASALQDHALEAGHGVPVPPCPGHHHPLTAALVDGEAEWVCPASKLHHREPILS